MRYRKTRNNTRQAEEILDRAFQTERRADTPPASELTFLKTRVEAQLADRTRETSIMATIMQSIRSYPKLTAGAVAFAAFLVFSILIPLPYSSVVGYTVSLTAPSDSAVEPNAYVAALSAVGIENSSVNLSDNGAEARYTIVGLKSETEANATVSAYKALTGIEPTATSAPVIRRVSGTLYAQALEKLFRIEVATDGLTDAEIAAQIAEQIKAQGGTVKNVTIDTDANGQKNIQIDIESDGQ
ncbi:MAG: hypothetical protein KKA81_16245 [Bacteroidetes bacterium]|nr:hypothetical protein [Bacteroidota bacterium]